MPVYDLIAAAVAASLVVRGWLWGALREAIEVVVLIVGVAVIVRFSPVVGSIIAGMANIPFEVARISTGVVLFLGLVIGGTLVARLVSTTLKLVPGTTIANRLGGAAVGAGYAVLIVALGTTLLSAAPMRRSVRSAVDGSIGSSIVGHRIVEPHGMVQETVSSVSGERVFATVIALHEMVGSRLAAGTLPIPLPDIGESTLSSSEEAAHEVDKQFRRAGIGIIDGPFGLVAVQVLTR